MPGSDSSKFVLRAKLLKQLMLQASIAAVGIVTTPIPMAVAPG
jgi:hypothetical protein